MLDLPHHKTKTGSGPLIFIYQPVSFLMLFVYVLQTSVQIYLIIMIALLTYIHAKTKQNSKLITN